MGIYSDSGSFSPQNLIVDGGIERDLAGGLKQGSVGNFTLTPGLYWGCLIKNATATFFTVQQSNPGNLAFIGLSAPSSSSFTNGRSGSLAYTSLPTSPAMPATAPTTALTATVPAIYLRTA
ncbi:hypothetical protein [Nostoc piscinale]|nr:hypothetical protein [Nostoc piscinale]